MELGLAGKVVLVTGASTAIGRATAPAFADEEAGEAAATKRVSHPDDAARMIVYLCSAADANTTGEAIRTDGHFLTPG